MPLDTDNTSELESPLRNSSERLTIRFFTGFVHPQGTYFRFHNLARELAARGHSVTVHASDQNWRSLPRTEVRDGVEYEIYSESRPVGPVAAPMHPLTALRRARRAPPKCDVAHMFQPFISALGAWRLTTASLHVFDWDEMWAGGLIPPRTVMTRPGVMALLVLERAIVRYSQHTTVVGQWLADKARTWGARGSVQVIHNGFNPRPLHDKSKARADLGLDPDALYLGFIGRTSPQFEWCLDALERASARHRSLRLAVAGPMNELIGTASASVRGRTDYLGDLSVERAQLCAEAIDIGLLPMRNDVWNRGRFPIKFADYIAAGLHVVCSSVGECGRLGELFDEVTPAGTTHSEWIAAVEQAVDRCAQLSWPRRVTGQGASAELSWPAIAAQLEGFYRSELGRPSLRARPSDLSAVR